MTPLLLRCGRALVGRSAATQVFMPRLTRPTTTSAPPPLPPALEEFDRLFKRYFAFRAAVYGVSTLVGAGVLYGWSAWNQAQVQRTMLSIFEAGGQPGWDVVHVNTEDHIARPALAAELTKLLQPAVTRHYVVILGETGTGKTTAVVQAARALPWPKGVVYFSSPSYLALFSIELSKAVGFSPHVVDPFGFVCWLLFRVTKKDVLPKPKDEPERTWSMLESALENTAIAYKAKHGRPMTLIIDGADFVAINEPCFFAHLQDFAKQCADRGLMTFVFVPSEGSGLSLLQSSSEIPRARMVLEVGDFPDDDAVKYLVNGGVPPDLAKKVVRTVTGGRLWLLLFYASRYKTAGAKDFCKPPSLGTAMALWRHGLAGDHALFRRLLKDGSILGQDAAALVGADRLQGLLDDHVLAMHADRTCSFQARAVESFFRKAIAEADRRGAGCTTRRS